MTWVDQIRPDAGNRRLPLPLAARHPLGRRAWLHELMRLLTKRFRCQVRHDDGSVGEDTTTGPGPRCRREPAAHDLALGLTIVDIEVNVDLVAMVERIAEQVKVAAAHWQVVVVEKPEAEGPFGLAVQLEDHLSRDVVAGRAEPVVALVRAEQRHLPLGIETCHRCCPFPCGWDAPCGQASALTLISSPLRTPVRRKSTRSGRSWLSASRNVSNI